MKAKTAAIFLVIVCLVLGGAFWYRHSAAEKVQEEHLSTIVHLSNEWTKASVNLNDQRTVNETLLSDLDKRTDLIKTLSNNLALVSSNLAKSQAEAQAAAQAAQTATQAAAAAEAVTKQRDAKINELESERDDLTKRMADLNGSIGKLETTIAETKRKLATSEGDRDYLLKELKRLQTEKADLERRFQDLALLREQVRKLRDELSITRRLEWIRRGIYGETLKGAERLQRGFTGVEAKSTNGPLPATASPAELNVELTRDGATKITTNAPPAKPSTSE